MRRYVRGGSAQKLDWLVVEEITQLDMALWADLACVGLNDVKFLLLPAVLDSWAGRPISAPLEHSQLIRDLAGGHRHELTENMRSDPGIFNFVKWLRVGEEACPTLEQAKARLQVLRGAVRLGHLALLSQPRHNGPGQVRLSGARQAREQQGVARQAVAYRVVHPVPPPLFGPLRLHARRLAAQQRLRLFHAVDRRAVRVAQRLQRPQPLREALRRPLRQQAVRLHLRKVARRRVQDAAEPPATPRLCQNNDCCFAPDGSRSRTLRRLGLCVFCDPTQMAEACLRRPYLLCRTVSRAREVCLLRLR